MNGIAVRDNQRSFDLVILPGLAQVPAGSGKALAAFAQAGGGVLLFLGDGISANRYNSEFRELLPARLGAAGTPADTGSSWRIGDYDTNSPVFAPFRAPHSGNLRIPEFTRRFTLSPAEGALVLARLEEEVPLLIMHTVGGGRVAVVNSSADTSWNDWPKHKTFVPWLHELGKYLARHGGESGVAGTNQFFAGETFEFDFDLDMNRGVGVALEAPSAGKGPGFKLQPPDGKEVALAVDNSGRSPGVDLALPGIYSLRDPAGKEIHRFAVNIPPEEGDLAAVSANEFQKQITRVQEPGDARVAAGFFGPRDDRKELWRLFLLGVLALLFIEVFTANRSLP
jgi:hypothetical protein